MTGRLRAAFTAALVVGATSFIVGPSVPAVAKQCSGVDVYVDFAALGGGLVAGCTPNDPDNGVAALQQAGFTPTRAAQQPGYFVCRINGKPAGDPCQRSSPADAFWSYWHSTPAGEWQFSNTGPADYNPRPGVAEGWAFGDGKPPSAPPPRATPEPPPPRTRQRSSPPPAGQTGRPSAAPEATSSAPVASAPRPQRSTPGSVGSPTARQVRPSSHVSALALPAISPTSPALDAAAAPLVGATDGDGSSSPAGVLAGAVIMSLLLGAAAQQAWLRRRAGRLG
ncbi:MAG TPA: hypothetical protein VNA30_03300 [Mycobacteriales bacterium]|nr:hypothetical protein [Mycobacteriales bacterium]